ncbi:hypothetical protein SH2C18_38810 [Clostridium sediminicola]|uniref:hypothetical protein n=1 Tax=Clostridium sediminicola TaxID=3114879 RepID=UPI0031F1EB30
MLKNNYNFLFGCIIISIGIIIHGYIIKPNNSNLFNSESLNKNITLNKTVFGLTDAAEYLNMGESDVKAIIIAESSRLNETHSFTGEMLPYFQVDEKYYFYKEGLDAWLADVTMDKRKYNTTNFEMER